MASIPVSFDEIKELWEDHCKCKITVLYNCMLYDRGFFVVKEGTMTFEDVAKIETLRRNIESLQVILSKQANMQFGYFSDEKHVWVPFGKDLDPVLRETLCKHTVVQITKLLDDAARLGVDVSPSKEVLLTFLKEIKPRGE